MVHVYIIRFLSIFLKLGWHKNSGSQVSSRIRYLKCVCFSIFILLFLSLSFTRSHSLYFFIFFVIIFLFFFLFSKLLFEFISYLWVKFIYYLLQIGCSLFNLINTSLFLKVPWQSGNLLLLLSLSLSSLSLTPISLSFSLFIYLHRHTPFSASPYLFLTSDIFLYVFYLALYFSSIQFTSHPPFTHLSFNSFLNHHLPPFAPVLVPEPVPVPEPVSVLKPLTEPMPLPGLV